MVLRIALAVHFRQPAPLLLLQIAVVWRAMLLLLPLLYFLFLYMGFPQRSLSVFLDERERPGIAVAH